MVPTNLPYLGVSVVEELDELLRERQVSGDISCCGRIVARTSSSSVGMTACAMKRDGILKNFRIFLR